MSRLLKQYNVPKNLVRGTMGVAAFATIKLHTCLWPQPTLVEEQREDSSSCLRSFSVPYFVMNLSFPSVKEALDFQSSHGQGDTSHGTPVEQVSYLQQRRCLGLLHRLSARLPFSSHSLTPEAPCQPFRYKRAAGSFVTRHRGHGWAKSPQESCECGQKIPKAQRKESRGMQPGEHLGPRAASKPRCAPHKRGDCDREPAMTAQGP